MLFRSGRELGLVDGSLATVSVGEFSVTAPVIETVDMADGVVWVPSNSEGSHLPVPSGTIVNVRGGAA